MVIALRGTFAATGIACLLACAPAYATESSVDAYAGEAAVLGKPSHHVRLGRSGRRGEGGGTTTSRESTGQGTKTGGASSGSSAGGGPSSGSGSPAGAGAGKPATSSQSGEQTGGGAPKAGHVSGSASPSAPPSSYPAESASSASLSSLDIALIVAGIFLLVATALLLRRNSPTTE